MQRSFVEYGLLNQFGVRRKKDAGNPYPRAHEFRYHSLYTTVVSIHWLPPWSAWHPPVDTRGKVERNTNDLLRNSHHENLYQLHHI